MVFCFGITSGEKSETEERWAYEHRSRQQHKTRSKGESKRTIQIVRCAWFDPRGRDYCTRVNALASSDQARAGG